MRESTLRFYKERMIRVLVYIHERLDERLSLETLAALACLSPHHFHHVFTGMLGESLASHVRRLRLERAALRLKFTRLSVLEIALEAGYETHEAFSRAFRAAFGIAPREYRRSSRAGWQIRMPSGIHYRRDGKLKSFRTVTGAKTMNVTIQKLVPRRVAFMRHIGPYDQVGQTWDAFLMRLGKEGMIGGDSRFLGICHDDPAVTPPSRIRYDCCVTVDRGFRPAGEIGTQTIPGGEYGMMTHFGPYDQLGKSYAILFGQWLPRSGRILRATPCFEVYLNAPESTAPEDLLTDLYIPLEPLPPSAARG